MNEGNMDERSKALGEIKPTGQKPALTISAGQVESLINKRAENNPAKRQELLTRARVLRPLVEDPNKLNLSEQEQQVVRKYARSAGERARMEEQDRSLEPIAGLTFNYQGQALPLNRANLDNPLYFKNIREAVLPLGFREGVDNKGLLTRIINQLRQRDITIRGPMGDWETITSMSDFLKLSDDDLFFGIRNVGLKGVDIIKRATQKIREGLAELEIPSKATSGSQLPTLPEK